MLEFKDDLFVNQDFSVVSYIGEWPFKMRRFIPSLFKEKLEISGSHIYPKYIGWDMTDGTFKGKWMAEKKVDRWSKLEFLIWCWGVQNDGTRGWMKAKTAGFLKTQYLYANSIQKSMWYSYSLIFYDNQRVKHAERGRLLMIEMWEEIQRRYGMRK